MAYARRALINLSIDRWRKRREWAVDELPEAQIEVPQHRLDDRDQVGRLLDTLPPRQRTVIVLRYLDDLTEREVANT